MSNRQHHSKLLPVLIRLLNNPFKQLYDSDHKQWKLFCKLLSQTIDVGNDAFLRQDLFVKLGTEVILDHSNGYADLIQQLIIRGHTNLLAVALFDAMAQNEIWSSGLSNALTHMAGGASEKLIVALLDLLKPHDWNVETKRILKLLMTSNVIESAFFANFVQSRMLSTHLSPCHIVFIIDTLSTLDPTHQNHPSRIIVTFMTIWANKRFVTEADAQFQTSLAVALVRCLPLWNTVDDKTYVQQLYLQSVQHYISSNNKTTRGLGIVVSELLSSVFEGHQLKFDIETDYEWLRDLDRFKNTKSAPKIQPVLKLSETPTKLNHIDPDELVDYGEEVQVEYFEDTEQKPTTRFLGQVMKEIQSHDTIVPTESLAALVVCLECASEMEIQEFGSTLLKILLKLDGSNDHPEYDTCLSTSLTLLLKRSNTDMSKHVSQLAYAKTEISLYARLNLLKALASLADPKGPLDQKKSLAYLESFLAPLQTFTVSHLTTDNSQHFSEMWLLTMTALCLKAGPSAFKLFASFLSALKGSNLAKQSRMAASVLRSHVVDFPHLPDFQDTISLLDQAIKSN
ncbi:hypothetical protein EDD86DRAFT_215649 [Gorgonomyces haynaldii]|nr:hypothetical protein EDD86DRAFT_215649 [Gorgonomyces haynaldii]